MGLKIGAIDVDPPVVLAPMAGVTNIAFRRLCRTYGRGAGDGRQGSSAGLYVSEMITARALVEGNPRSLRMSAFGDDEPVRSLQLYGTDPVVMGVAVRRLVDEVGVDHIDLNFGCPAAKVTKKGGGGVLPVHRTLFRNVVRAAITAAGAVPVTVKTRLGIDDDHVTFLDAGRIAEDEGCAAIALHARTVEQLYSGVADWSAIAALKDAVTTIPVLGNGDIWEASDARRMVEETGCDGVVVGRGCLGRPWLFRDLADAFAGRPLQPPPALGDVVAMMRLHARLLAELLGEEQGCRDFRKHVAWYLTGFPVGGARRKAMAMVATLDELDRHLDELDPSEPFPESARRTKRGHTNGPRPVHLPPGWLDDVDDPTPPEGADVLVSGG
ncbi:MAG TPA: tRNA dihydrouridine synthase DusB [Acidimicrobiales bacterium]|nr:tRNA dihydrouridine synthase DusB [Acidimicrobiales bacterium]